MSLPSGAIHTKWRAPTRSAARRSRQAASPLSSSTVARGWSRAPPARWTTVSTPRSALRHDGRVGEVADRQLDPHALRSEPPRVAHQAADGRAARDQPPHDARGPAIRWRLSAKARSIAQPMPPFAHMAYVIAEPCIGTKDNSCVEVCPVDCIHPTPDEPDYDKVEMLYIDPDECIDCDACVEACPVDACFAEDQLPEEWASFAEQRGYARLTARAASARRAASSTPLGHRQRHPDRLRRPGLDDLQDRQLRSARPA